MKRIYWIAPLLIMSARLWAADAGTTSAEFLRIGVSPRAIAMGGAQVGLADDVYATYWNPAGLAQLQVPEAALTYNSYVEKISQQYAAVAIPQGKWGTVGASLNYLNLGKFGGYDAAGQPIGDVGANDMALGVSYGVIVLQNPRKASHLSVGLTGKWIREKLDSVSASATAFDAGLHWSAGKSLGEELEGLQLGATVRNIGQAMKYDQDSFNLPRTYVAGMAYTGHWREEAITFAADGEKPQAGQGFASVGLEVWTLRTLVLRGGYTTQGHLGNGLRLGAGLRLRTLSFDYAFANAGDFGGEHRAGVSFRFGERPPEPLVIAESWYDKGVKSYRKARYTEALVDFNKALEIDPHHPQALDMMKKTYEAIKQIQTEVPHE